MAVSITFKMLSVCKHIQTGRKTLTSTAHIHDMNNTHSSKHTFLHPIPYIHLHPHVLQFTVLSTGSSKTIGLNTARNKKYTSVILSAKNRRS
jgi:hypothetical protein